MPRLPTTPAVTDEATITTEAAESVGGVGCIVVEEGAWEEVVGEIKVSNFICKSQIVNYNQ